MSLFSRAWSAIKGWFQTKKPAPVLRPLTKAEHEKLGLKPSRKLFVRASVTKPNKRTNFFSNRQGTQQKLGTTKENASLKRRTESFEGLKTGKPSTHYKNLTLHEFKRLLKKQPKDTVVIPSFFGANDKTSGRYVENNGVAWVMGERSFSQDIIPHLGDLQARAGFTKHYPTRYGLIVYTKKA